MRGKIGRGSGSGAPVGVPPQARASRLAGGVGVPTAASTSAAARGMAGRRPVATMRTASRPFQRMRARRGVGPSLLMRFHGSRATRYWFASARRRQSASSAREKAGSAIAARYSATDRAATSISGLPSQKIGGVRPPKALRERVTTRLAVLPRSFARSLL